VSLSNADLRDANLLGAERKAGTSLDGITWGNTTCSDGSNSDHNDGDNFTCESNFLVNQTLTARAYDADGAVTTSNPVTVRVR
jgi:hypothetical protein